MAATRTALTVTVAPVRAPVDKGFFAAHARIDADVDDALIELYVRAACDTAENYAGIVTISQTMRWVVNRRPLLGQADFFSMPVWDRNRTMWEIPRWPVQSVTSLIVYDDSGASTTLDPSCYTADLAMKPALLTVDWDAVNAFQAAANAPLAYPLQHWALTFVAGFGSDPAVVPSGIRLAIMLMATWYYEHRGDDGAEPPAAITNLLNSHRIVYFA